MPTYKFKKEKDPTNPYDDTDVFIKCETEDLTQLIEAFEDFIGACGFGPKRIELAELDDDKD